MGEYAVPFLGKELRVEYGLLEKIEKEKILEFQFLLGFAFRGTGVYEDEAFFESSLFGDGALGWG